MILAILLLALGISADVGRAVAAVESQPPAETIPAGLWPTERMVEGLVRRWALEAADLYDLSEEQHQQVEARMLKRWPKFLQQNRRELQPLVNEYFEARLGLEPPPRQKVQTWASRALPMLEKVQEQIEAGNEEIRPLLSAAQQMKFQTQVLEMRAGVEFYRQRLGRWKEGRFETREWWDPPPSRRRRPISQPAGTGVARQPPDQIVAELQAWDRYVADFIARHNLDEGQQNAALSILKELKERALAHRDGHRAEVIQLERRIAAGKTEDAQTVARELQRLYGPIDEVFGELEERLQKIPTETQQRAATQPAAKAEE